MKTASLMPGPSTIESLTIPAMRSLDIVFDSFPFLSTFGFVEAVEGTYQITGDSSDPFEFDVALGTSALRTGIADDAVIAADRVSVDRMVDGTITDSGIVHAADDLFKGFQVLGRIAVHLDVRDVAGVGKCVIRSLDLDLVIG